MNITLIVSGSIAAYKSAELVRELVKRKHNVHVVLTRSAEKFITSLTMQTLSGNPVTTDLFDEAREAEINHIRLADTADVVVIAPASANILAKLAHGIADDAATTVLLATRSPVIVAPAMNVNMWFNVATQENLEKLKARGVSVVPPEEGELACGWQGAGRLAENRAIVSAIDDVSGARDLAGYRIIVSAGPTREAIDPIRFISNRSSGKMGFALARQAARRGAEVILVSGPVSLETPQGVSAIRVSSAIEMRVAIRGALENKSEKVKGQLLVMAAAVCDHRPETVSQTKLKQEKKAAYAVALTPNDDILQGISLERSLIEKSSGLPLTLVGFAAESEKGEALRRNAKGKLVQKGLDFVVANSIDEAAEQDETQAWVIDKLGNEQQLERATKDAVADKILSIVVAA